MSKPARIVGLVAGIALTLGALPLTSGWGKVGNVEIPVLRPMVVCAQASSCKQANNFICSTYHQDWEDYVCNTGCASEEE